MKVVINAIIARRNGGGATQIVLNYIYAALADTNVDWYYIISEELYEIIKTSKLINSSHCLVIPRQPQLKSYFSSKKKISAFLDLINPDLVYSILAPSYYSFKYPEVMRCCNAWDVIDKSDEAFSIIDSKTKLKFKMKTCLVRYLMKRADFFITQTEVAKEGIVRVTGVDGEKVIVIPNVLPRFFKSVIPVKKPSKTIDILYVASPSPHKNLEIIPRVANILRYEFGMKGFRFLITIPSEDSGVASKITRLAQELSVDDIVVNIGGKSQQELVELYESVSIGFFPSILETFSATLLEYMYFSLPIVASNKPFNTEVLHDAAMYFEATDAQAAANAIISIVNNPSLRDVLIDKSATRIKDYLDYNKHFERTVDFFNRVVMLSGNNKVV